jgi:hypothetical protein
MFETIERITANCGIECLNRMLSGEPKFSPYRFHLQGRRGRDGNHVQDYTVLQPRRQLPAFSPSREPQISKRKVEFYSFLTVSSISVV